MKCVTRLAACRLAVAACALWALVPAASAVTLYDNLANQNNGYFGFGPGNWIAERFRSDATNLRLTDVTVRLTAPTPAPYSLSLYSDASGLPGVQLANLFTGTSAGGDVHYAVNALTAPSTPYWIVASVAAGTSINTGWGASTTLTGTGTGFFPLVATSGTQGLTWTTRGDIAQQMQILATTVPEPAVAATLVGVATIMRRRRA